MSYLTFLLLLILPPLLVSALLYRRHPAISARGMKPAKALAAVAAIAFVYTVPWDNYLVYRGVWNYGADRVLGTIGYVPVEEYLFFILQPLLTGFWYLARLPKRRSHRVAARDGRVRVIGAAVFLAATGAGLWMLRSEPTLYMGLILVWAAPVLAFQWAYAGDSLWHLRLPISMGVVVPTLYLWVADRIAIGAGIWSISEVFTTGIHLFGLPIEEAVFFLTTNVLVVFGITIFVAPLVGR